VTETVIENEKETGIVTEMIGIGIGTGPGIKIEKENEIDPEKKFPHLKDRNFIIQKINIVMRTIHLLHLLHVALGWVFLGHVHPVPVGRVGESA